MTLLISTASIKRFLSSHKIIKPHSRLIMSDKRLNDLLVIIAVENYEASTINLTFIISRVIFYLVFHRGHL